MARALAVWTRKLKVDGGMWRIATTREDDGPLVLVVLSERMALVRRQRTRKATAELARLFIARALETIGRSGSA